MGDIAEAQKSMSSWGPDYALPRPGYSMHRGLPDAKRKRDFIPGSSFKVLRPIHLKRIEDYYKAPENPLPELCPTDLFRKWESNFHKDKQLSAVLMNIAPSVVSVSTFHGVERRVDCSGLIIEWNARKCEATVLTSARILRIGPSSVWDNFFVVVRLSSGKILLAEEDYVDYHHNIVTLKVKCDVELKAVNLWQGSIEEISEGTNVIALGRNFSSCNFVESGGVINTDYPYFGCEELLSSTCNISEFCEGGPIITKSGYVCGITFYDGRRYGHPLPTPVIYSCLENWHAHGRVVRPWFGLIAINADELSHDVLEKLSFSPDIKGVVVKQVCKESPASKHGVCPGDFVTLCDKVSISSVRQYSQVVSDISNELSAHCSDTVHSTRKVEAVIQRRVHGDSITITVMAENLAVNDRRFCFRWPQGESACSKSTKPGSERGWPCSDMYYVDDKLVGFVL